MYETARCGADVGGSRAGSLACSFMHCVVRRGVHHSDARHLEVISRKLGDWRTSLSTPRPVRVDGLADGRSGRFIAVSLTAPYISLSSPPGH